MLEKSSDEFLGRKAHHLPGLFPGVLVAKPDLATFYGENATVGDGDSVHVAREVLEDPLRSLHPRFAVDHPVLFPNRARELHLR